MNHTVHIGCSSCLHAVQGLSPVHLAVQRNAYASVEVLLSHGADVNIQDHRVCAFSSCYACAPLLKSTLQARTTSAQLAQLVVVYLFGLYFQHVVERADCAVCAATGTNQFALLCAATPCADACSFANF